MSVTFTSTTSIGSSDIWLRAREAGCQATSAARRHQQTGLEAAGDSLLRLLRLPVLLGGSGNLGRGSFFRGGRRPYHPPRNTVSEEVASRRREEEREAAEPHLRSSVEVIGYDITAQDGKIGHVEDFIVDSRYGPSSMCWSIPGTGCRGDWS